MYKYILHTVAIVFFYSGILPSAAANSIGTPTVHKPLQFIQNVGQIKDQLHQPRTDIDFKLEAEGITIFAGSGQLHYQWVRHQGDSTTIYRMDVTLSGADKQAQMLAEQASGYYEYHYGSTTPDGAMAKGYRKITYKNVYPHIDWVLYTQLQNGQQTLKYDFVVHPGGNPANIRLQYSGAIGLQLAEGMLRATTPYGSITDGVPYSYNAANKAPIATQYVVDGNIVQFQLAVHDADALVIDPSLSWSTYYGGNAIDFGGQICVDTAGNVIMAGSSNSTGIATSGAHKTTLAPGAEATGFLGKFDKNGDLLWCTYHSDSGSFIHDIACDSSGNIFIGGSAGANTGIGTANAHKPNKSNTGIDEGFLAKFNPAGSKQWGTYYGIGHCEIISISCDHAGNVYVGGRVGDVNIVDSSIATSGAHITSVSTSTNAINDGFLAKFNTNGIRQWGTFYPGRVLAVCNDLSGNVYILGQADTAGIATAGAFIATYSTNTANYLAKFNTNGVRQWGTYYYVTSGTSNYSESGLGITTDVQENLIVATYTTVTSSVTTAGAHQTSFGGGFSDGLISKFTNTGTRLWTTYYGGSNIDYLARVATGPNAEIYVIGQTSSSNAIVTGNAIKSSSQGGDAYIGIFSPGGQRLYGTYYGGNITEFFGGHRLAMDIKYHADRLHISGSTNSNSGIATPMAEQTTLKGTGDAFLAQIELEDTAVYMIPPYTDTLLCTTDTLYVPYGVTHKFNSNNSFIIQLSNSSGSFASPTTLATINSDTAGIATCYIPTSIAAGSGYKYRIVASSPARTSIDNGKDITVSGYPAMFSSGSNSPICSGKALNLNSGTTTTGVTYTWTGPNSYTSALEDPVISPATLAATGDYYITVDNNGCMVKDTVTVVVNQTPQNITIGSNSPICTGDTMKLNVFSTTTGVTYSWTGPANYNTANVSKPNATVADSGIYTGIVTLGSCSDSDTVRMVINPGPQITAAASPGGTICDGTLATFAAVLKDVGTAPQYQWVLNGVNIPGATNPTYSSSAINNGDVVALQVTPNTKCGKTKTSNPITMTVLQTLAPSVSITATPNTSLFPNEPVSFTATPADAGNSPDYQWLRNGVPVGGATSSIWGANANFLSDGDEICAMIYSDYQCPSPDSAKSNCIKLQIRVSVENINTASNIKIYPNPTSDHLFIKGADKDTDISLYDVTGRLVYQSVTQQEVHSMSVSQLPTGHYILQLTDANGNRSYSKVNKE